jgi:hypothetical protein
MDLVSMAQKEPGEGIYATSPAMAPSPYPYGLRLCLGMEQLAALGYTELPPAGTEVRIEAIGVVTKASSEDPDADGDVDYVSVEIQVKEMGLEEEGESAGEDIDDDDGLDQPKHQDGRAERMYQKGKQPA